LGQARFSCLRIFIRRLDLRRRPCDAHVLQASVDLVDEINRICKPAAVERQVGGKNGGGAMLTPFGASLIARYRKIEGSVGRAVRKELRALRAEIA
jgi:molybdate transport repressor ModE-like protein